MRRTVITLFSAALIIACAQAANEPRMSSHDNHAAPSDNWANATPFSRVLLQAMNQMHFDMVKTPPTGDPDRDFLIMMIAHHEGAVEMARLVLISGKDPLVRTLAEEIIAGQQAEIAAMKSRLAILQKGADPWPDNFPALSGTRGQ